MQVLSFMLKSSDGVGEGKYLSSIGSKEVNSVTLVRNSYRTFYMLFCSLSSWCLLSLSGLTNNRQDDKEKQPQSQQSKKSVLLKPRSQSSPSCNQVAGPLSSESSNTDASGCRLTQHTILSISILRVGDEMHLFFFCSHANFSEGLLWSQQSFSVER